MARIVVIVVAVALAALPAAVSAAPGGGGAAQQQAPAAQQQLLQDAPAQEAPTPVQQAPQQTEADSGSIGTTDLLLIALGIAALIGGIWFVIARDARRVTAGRVRTADGEIGAGRGGSATRAARRSRKPSTAERKRRKRGRAH